MKKSVITLFMAVCLTSSTLATISNLLTANTPYPLTNTGWAVELYDQFQGSVFVTLLRVEDVGEKYKRIVIEIDKDFQSSAFNDMGIGQTCALKFILMDEDAPDYTPFIVINDEKIENNTGVAWTDFHMHINGWNLTADYPYAEFDPDYNFTPGVDGNPFETVEMAGRPFYDEDGMIYDTINFYDGIVAAGTDFTPGNDDSYALIKTDMSEGQYFILKEYPTIPEPMTLSVLSLGGLMMFARKRIRR